MKELVVLGGPNGAGKTTAAQTMIPKVLSIREFVNADEIARGLSPFNPEASAMAAGRLMVERIRALADVGESFAFETTCAGRGHARLLQLCRAAGYRITLVFLWLPSVEAALKRVARRVREGGHSVPAEIVRRRYLTGLRNMRTLYLPVIDIAMIFDNWDEGRVIITEWIVGTALTVRDTRRWALIEEATIMTDMTPRELLDAIARSLRETGRRFSRKRVRPSKKQAKSPVVPARMRAKKRPKKKSAGPRRRA